MIPKIIHYCWISGEENMPDDIKACIATWKEHLPDYQFINWNDSNFDWNICEFTKKWREKNHYAYCSDYVRVWALYNYGGIYLDSDVMVYKSFDELLDLDRFMTTETFKWSLIETAIMGCEKGDEIMKMQLDWFNNYKSSDEYVLSPQLATDLIREKYETPEVDDLTFLKENKTKDKVYLLKNFKFFNRLGDCCFAEHKFKDMWLDQQNKIDEDLVGIFVYADSEIKCLLPKKSKKYTILAADSTIKDDNHKVIYIDDYDFCKKHKISYREGCGMRYLYEHPEILPEYIVFYHNNKTFSYYIEAERMLWLDIIKLGVLISNPMCHQTYTENGLNGFNGSGLYWDHFKDDVDAFIVSIKESANDYWNTFKNDLFFDVNQYGENCFGMKKENFLEMCEMCFKVLDHFDEKMGYGNDDDVINKVKENIRQGKQFKFNEEWHYHLHSYLLERLTELYYRQKYNLETCRKTWVMEGFYI